MNLVVEIMIGITSVNVCVRAYRWVYRRGFTQGVRKGGAHVRAEFAYEALKHVNNPAIHSIYEKASRQ